jgi:hypothetical protein
MNLSTIHVTYNKSAVVISGFRRVVNEIFALLERYTRFIGCLRRLGRTYRSHIPGQGFYELLDP